MNETEYRRRMDELEAKLEWADHEVKMARFRTWVFALAALAVLVLAVVSQMWLLLIAVAIMLVAVILSFRNVLAASSGKWRIVRKMREIDGV